MKLLTTLLLALSVGCAAETMQGFVSDVHDGDTVKFTQGKETYKIRLEHIDAPELDQLYGYASRTSLIQLTLYKRGLWGDPQPEPPWEYRRTPRG